MILDPKDAESRLNSPDNLINKLGGVQPIPASKVTIIPKNLPGQTKENKLPKFMRTQIAIAVGMGGSQKEIAGVVGKSQQAISEIHRGKTKGADEAAVDRALGRVRDMALEKLMGSMGMITDEKLEKCKPVELSNIAANMGRIVEKTLPREVGVANGANVIIYAPQIRTEQSYNTVEVG